LTRERIERALAARLEELARVGERAGPTAPAFLRLLGAASVATTNAVALDVLPAATARAIWRDAAERHPVLYEATRPRVRDAA
jgi:hypothetical protein